MGMFTELFAWWTGNTIGTRLFTWRRGIRVGSDELGNVYYREKNGPKRWVIYRDLSEASLVPPEWHGWLHYIVDVPPTEQSYQTRPWELPLAAEHDRYVRSLSATGKHAEPKTGAASAGI